MNPLQQKQIRDLAIELLDNDIGIPGDAYNLLYNLMFDAGNCDDIIRGVEATDDMFYLPVDWNK
jgi:hypothetical protein